MKTKNVLLASFLFLFSSVAAAVESPYGVNAHLPGPAELDAAEDAGFAWVRYDFNWFQIEPNDGEFHWEVQDAAVDAAVARGLNVFVTLAYTPSWAAVDPTCVIDDPDETHRCQSEPFIDIADWEDFVEQAVLRYEDRVKVWGMWNEPNLRGFYQGTQAQYVAEILVPGAATVHATCADCLVAGPETAGLTKSSNWNGSNGICAFGSCIRNGWELDLAGVLDQAASSLDIITQHFYNDDAEKEAVGQLCDGQFFGTTMTHDSLRGVLAAHGGFGKPVWLSETGFETSAATEGTQATFLPALLLARQQLAFGNFAPAVNDPFVIQRIFIYDLKDGNADGWGLLREDGSAKPAFAAVKQFIADHPPGSFDTAPSWIAIPTVSLEPGVIAPEAIDLWAFANDAETASSALTYTLPDAGDAGAGITLASGRWISVAPTAGWSGETAVSVGASDGVHLTNTSLSVKVALTPGPTATPTPNGGDDDDAGGGGGGCAMAPSASATSALPLLALAVLALLVRRRVS